MSALLIACGGDPKKEVAQVEESEVIESYVYLLGRALAVRQEKIDASEEGFEYNKIKYNEPRKAEFVNPNLDVAYLEAWFAVDDNSAVLLEVPEVTNRYYTVQLMDPYGEVFTNINERNYPDKPFGVYALCTENTKADIPPDAYRVIVPTKKVKMLARVELQDTWEEAVRLQESFVVKEVIGQPVIDPIPPVPSFSNEQIITSELFDYVDDLFLMPDTQMPKASELQATAARVAEYMNSSGEHANEVEEIIATKAIPQFIEYIKTKAGKYENNWLGTLTAGEFKGNNWTRTAANFVGIWANSSTEVIYFIASTDASGEPLGNGKRYVLEFSPEQHPKNNIDAFWSVILVDFPGYRVVPNELDRFNLNNFSGLQEDEDGVLKIYISPQYDEAWPKTNWLPSPAEGLFNLTFRMYVPRENVVSGDWFPNALVELNE